MPYSIQAPSQLSAHLRAFRKSRGLSQAELGKRLALSQARIARIEGDPLSISVEQLLQVLAALGVRIDLESISSIHGSPAPARSEARGSSAAGSKAKPAKTRSVEADW